MVKDLIQTLQELTEAHEVLLQLALQKRKLMTENADIEGLSKVTAKETQQLKGIGQLERRRMDQVEQIVNRLGIPKEQVTANGLLAYLPVTDDRKELNAQRLKLSETIEKLKRENETNRLLIEQSLSYIEHTLDVLTEEPGGDLTYQNPQQQPKAGTNRSFFDRKA
jgi:hypothetical protein